MIYAIALLILSSVMLGIIWYEKKVLPSTCFLAMWMFLIGMALIQWGNNIWLYKGLCYIEFVCLIYYFFERLGRRKASRYVLNTEMVSVSISIKNVNMIIVVAIICGFFLVVKSARNYGYSLSTLHLWLSISSQAYGASVKLGGIDKVFLVVLLSSFLLDGYVFAYSKCVEIIYKCKLPAQILLITLYAMTSTNKSTIIWGTLLWISGWLTAGNKYAYSYERVLRFIRKHIKKLLGFTIGFIALMLLMLYIRSQNAFGILLGSFMNYLFGEVFIFSIWFEDLENMTLQHSHGRQLLFGLFDQIGRSEGLMWNWNSNIRAVLEYGMTNNIYTVFRTVIEDFGVVGSYIFWALLGIVTGRFELRVRKYICSSLSSYVLAMIYYFILMSFIASSGHTTVLLLVGILFFVELEIIQKRVV